MRTHKLISGLILGSFAIFFALFITPLVSFAADSTTPPITCNQLNSDGTVQTDASGNPIQVDCSKVGDAAATSGNCKSLSNCDLVQKYINPAITFLSVLVGLVVVASIIMGAIQYSSSGGNPQAAAAAKKKIQNAIIALVAYIFLVAVLNFIVPGGLL